MLIDDIQLEDVSGQPSVSVGGDGTDSEYLRLFFTTGWHTTWVDMEPVRLAELRDCINEALAKADHCEHGIVDGDWCYQCDRDRKQAMIDNA